MDSSVDVERQNLTLFEKNVVEGLFGGLSSSPCQHVHKFLAEKRLKAVENNLNCPRQVGMSVYLNDVVLNCDVDSCKIDLKNSSLI